MNGIQLNPLVIDTTFLLPAFGVEIDTESSERIEAVISSLLEGGGPRDRIFISDMSPLEAFLKAYRLAEKEKNEKGKNAAKLGFLAVTGASSVYTIVPHSDEGVFESAFEMRNSHSDPFDCFIFATAKVLGATLVTEDTVAEKFLGSNSVLSWNGLRKSLRPKK